MKPSAGTIFHGMHGLGDNIYQRPFVRAAAQRGPIFLNTSWPELYSDIPNVHFIKPNTLLRTQCKNVARTRRRWVAAPIGADVLRVSYGARDLEAGSILQYMESRIPLNGPLVMDLPPTPKGYRPPWPATGKPIAVVRPVTVRTEWTNTARNPKPEYIALLARSLARTHTVVTVADISPPHEVGVEPLPVGHMEFVKGELSVVDLIELCRAAAVLVGGVGWLVPMALALNKPAGIVLGGHGAHNRPEVITDPRIKHQIDFAQPDNFCQCSNMRHDCDKTIEGYERMIRNGA